MIARRALVALFATLLLVTGCSKPKVDDRPLPAPAPLLEQSSAYTKTQTSVHVTLVTTGDVPDLRIRTLEGDLTSTPAVAAKGKAGVLFSKPTDPPTNLEFLVVDGEIYGGLGGKWQSFGAVNQVYPIGNILDATRGLADILAHLKNPVAQGREQIGGIGAVRISGSVGPDVLSGIYPKADHEMVVTVWVREDGSHELLRALVNVSPGVAIDLTSSKWGEPVTVTKP